MHQDKRGAHTSNLTKEYFLREAKTRWLRPGEICEILQNSMRFDLSEKPLDRPPSGSVLLFDRKELRNYRKDGHDWRKKKNGKTVREAHEKLKCGNADVLHCYYAHGEHNSTFQRRIYRLLEKKIDNVVLVHYRDLGEDSSSPRGTFTKTDPTISSKGDHTNSDAFLTNSRSNFATQAPSCISGSSIGVCRGESPSQIKDEDYSNLGTDSVTEPLSFTSSENDGSQNSNTILDQVLDSFSLDQSMVPNSAYNINAKDTPQQPGLFDGAGFSCHNSPTANLIGYLRSNRDIGIHQHSSSSEQTNFPDTDTLFDNHAPNEYNSAQDRHSQSMSEEKKENAGSAVYAHKHGEFNGLYNFGTSMCKDYNSCDDSWMNREGHWNDLGTDSPSKEASSSGLMHLEPSYQYPSISPTVPISGNFLGDINPFDNSKGKVSRMILEKQELAPLNSLQCRAPSHVPDVPKDEFCLLVRFMKLLAPQASTKSRACELKVNLFLMLYEDKNEWNKTGNDDIYMLEYYRSSQDSIILKKLKERLYMWLLNRIDEDGRGLDVLDMEGQGVIHLAAALGYEWAIRAIVTVGISPNFRDARGRTGLHWAAQYGREEAVLELLNLQAAPGAFDDPTQEFPCGRTAADLAWSGGHTRISGYLTELDLKNHLSKLDHTEPVMENASANVVTENVFQIEQTQSNDLLGELDESVINTTVKNSALVASQVQAALMSESGCKRQLTWSTINNSQIGDDALAVAVSSLVKKCRPSSSYNDRSRIPATGNPKKVHSYSGQKASVKAQKQIERIESQARDDQIQKVADVEKALARVQSAADQPDAREQYIRLAKNFKT